MWETLAYPRSHLVKVGESVYKSGQIEMGPFESSTDHYSRDTCYRMSDQELRAKKAQTGAQGQQHSRSDVSCFWLRGPIPHLT